MRDLFKKTFCALILVSLSHAQASDCTQAQNPLPLKLVYPASSELASPVDVQFELNGDNLIALFNVRTATINAKPVLGPKEYPFQADVVELFLSVVDGAEPFPYYELELSPYENTYEVRIDSLKKPFVDNIKMGLRYEVKRSQSGWQARLEIPLKNLGWNGNPSAIRGNAYSILGKSPNRSFWSAFLPKQAKPSFHKPEFFKPLLQCR